jgi:hypothetical protein
VTTHNSLFSDKYLIFLHFRAVNTILLRMASSGMLHHVALVRTDVSEELSPSIIRVTRIGELGTVTHFIFLCSMRRLLVTANVVPSSPILVTLMMEALRSSETSVLTRVTRRNIPEDNILHIHRRENPKSKLCSVALILPIGIPFQCYCVKCGTVNNTNTFLIIQVCVIWFAILPSIYFISQSCLLFAFRQQLKISWPDFHETLYWR